jgi:hypothetical protein
VAFAADSKTVYLSGGDNGAVIVYDVEAFRILDSISLNGKSGKVEFEDSFTSDLLLKPKQKRITGIGPGQLPPGTV